MSVLLNYVLLGLSLSAPIGPINAAQMNIGIQRGFIHAWLLGLGAMAADTLYMLLVYFGFVHIIDYPFVKIFLWLFGAFVLIYTGIESIVSHRKEVLIESRSNPKEYRKTFFTGFLMSLSNPLTVMFWLGIYGSILAEKTAHLEVYEHSGA